MMLSHGIVQENFSTDIIVPLVKDKAGDANSLGNYRAIALTPVIAKILESVVFINVCIYLFKNRMLTAIDMIQVK
jgi:hypothetical protein